MAASLPCQIDPPANRTAEITMVYTCNSKVDEREDSDVGNARTSEMNFENVCNLSPIVEESESTLCCEETSLTVETLEESACKMTRPSPNEYQRISRETKGDSSSGIERTEQDYYQLRRVKGSYRCFAPDVLLKEAEASGDNDEAETGRRDRSSKTTVEQLKCRLSQVERKIVALKRYQNPRKCQSHESCEALRKDLQAWRIDHEKRIDSRIVRWQLTERQRTCDEMEKMKTVYDDIRRHLETLERRSTKLHSEFCRQIDAWEKRLKDEILTLHEDNLMDFREQLRTWLEIRDTVNLSDVQRKRDEMYKIGCDTSIEKQDGSDKWTKYQRTTSRQDNAELLHRIEHIIKFEVQRQRDDLAKRMDRKIAQLWSAFEDFKHNFHLDCHYRSHDYDEINNGKVEEVVTEDAYNGSDFTCQESAKSDLNTDSEERRAAYSKL